MQSIDLIETYEHGMTKYLVSENEDIKFSNTMNWYKKDQIWQMLQEKA